VVFPSSPLCGRDVHGFPPADITDNVSDQRCDDLAPLPHFPISSRECYPPLFRLNKVVELPPELMTPMKILDLHRSHTSPPNFWRVPLPNRPGLTRTSIPMEERQKGFVQFFFSLFPRPAKSPFPIEVEGTSSCPSTFKSKA